MSAIRVDATDSEATLHEAAISCCQVLAKPSIFHDEATESPWHLRPTDKVSEAEHRVRGRRAHDLLEERVELVGLEPLANVRKREARNAAIGKGAEVLGHRSIDECQAIPRRRDRFMTGLGEIGWHGVVVDIIAADEHVMQEVIATNRKLRERVLRARSKVPGEAGPLEVV